MRLSVKTAAMAILVSLGVTACSSGGGGGGSSAPANNPEQAKQIEALKKQVETEQQAAKSAKSDANQVSEKLKESEIAKAKAETELAKAQEALKNAENTTAAEKAKAQAAVEKAAQDLAAAQQAVKNAEAATAAEQAKAQAAADKAAKDLAKAREDIAKLEAELSPYLEEAKRKAQEEAERLAEEQRRLEEAQKTFTAESSTWRHTGENNNARSRYFLPNGDHFEWLGNDTQSGFDRVVADKINFYEAPTDDEVHVSKITAKGISQRLQNGNMEDVATNLGEKGTIYFVNQPYSTYASWVGNGGTTHNYNFGLDYELSYTTGAIKSKSGFVALQTENTAEFITQGNSATYKGKAIETGYIEKEDNAGMKTYTPYQSVGNLTLDANFKTGVVSGNIQNLKSGNYDLNNGNIVSSNDAVVFSGTVSQQNSVLNNYSYLGYFAGPNAEEAVGIVTYLPDTHTISFGGKRQ